MSYCILQRNPVRVKVTVTASRFSHCLDPPLCVCCAFVRVHLDACLFFFVLVVLNGQALMCVCIY